MKVLIVDDQADIGQNLKSLLLNRKYGDTKSVLSGKLALEAMRADVYNLVICDYNMPDMNGHEVFQAMRNEGFKWPFLLYTSAKLDSLPRFEGEGFIGIVDKKELAKLFILLKSVADGI